MQKVKSVWSVYLSGYIKNILLLKTSAEETLENVGENLEKEFRIILQYLLMWSDKVLL